MSIPGQDAEEEGITEIRETCPVFRVLIIGRANAGKTTILQKVCNVDKKTKPFVRDAQGHEIKDTSKGLRNKANNLLAKVKTSIRSSSPNRAGQNAFEDNDILRPSTQRGQHDITHQIAYPGSRFVFHDSRGIEAGGVDELQIIRDFLRERESQTSLADHLHAIWFCVPMDDRRPLAPKELAFFDEATGKVPVVVVFTKYDALLDRVKNDLWRDHGPNSNAADASARAESIYEKHYHSRVMGTAHPPKGIVRLQDMHDSKTTCPELSETTASAIDDISLKQLFISVQQNNLGLCMEAAIKLQLDLRRDKEYLVWDIWRLFPHAWTNIEWNKPGQWVHEVHRRRDDWWLLDDRWRLLDRAEFTQIFSSSLHQTFQLDNSVVKAQFRAAAVMIAADSFSQWRKLDDEWKWSLQRYKHAHNVQEHIQQEIESKFSSNLSEEDQASVILGVVDSALKLLKETCDK